MKLLNRVLACFLILSMMVTILPTNFNTVSADIFGDTTGSIGGGGILNPDGGAVADGLTPERYYPTFRIALVNSPDMYSDGSYELNKKVVEAYSSKYPNISDDKTLYMLAAKLAIGVTSNAGIARYNASNTNLDFHYGTETRKHLIKLGNSSASNGAALNVTKAAIKAAGYGTGLATSKSVSSLSVDKAWKSVLAGKCSIAQAKAIWDYILAPVGNTYEVKTRMNEVISQYAGEENTPKLSPAKREDIAAGYIGLLDSLRVLATAQSLYGLAGDYEAAIDRYIQASNLGQNPVVIFIDTAVPMHIESPKDAYLQVPTIDYIQYIATIPKDYTITEGTQTYTGAAKANTQEQIRLGAAESLKRWPVGSEKAISKNRVTDASSVMLPYQQKLVKNPFFHASTIVGWNLTRLRTAGGTAEYKSTVRDVGFLKLITFDVPTTTPKGSYGTGKVNGFMFASALPPEQIPGLGCSFLYYTDIKQKETVNIAGTDKANPKEPADLYVAAYATSSQLSYFENRLKADKTLTALVEARVFREKFIDDAPIGSKVEISTMSKDLSGTYTGDKLIEWLKGTPRHLQDMSLISPTPEVYTRLPNKDSVAKYKYTVEMKVTFEGIVWDLKAPIAWAKYEGGRYYDYVEYLIKAIVPSKPDPVTPTTPPTPTPDDYDIGVSELKQIYGFTSENQTFAEIKSNAINNERYEAMAGIPSTENLYFAAGGQEYILSVVLQYWVNEHNVKRTYRSWYSGTSCEYNKVGAGGDTWQGGVASRVPAAAGGVSPSGSVNFTHTGGTVTITWSGSERASCNYQSGCPFTHSGCPVFSRADYNAAKAEAQAFVSALNSSTQYTFTAASDGKARQFNFSKTGASASITTDTKGANGYAGSHADLTVCSGSPPSCTTIPHGSDSPGQACDKSFSIVVTVTMPAHAICGPCCGHTMPGIEDTWKQGLLFDFVKISQIRLYKIDQASVTGMTELTGTDEIFASIKQGDPTYFMNIAQLTEKTNPIVPHNLGGIPITDILAHKNTYFSGENRAAAQSSRAGRIRYSVEPTQHDVVVWGEGVRTNHCDGLATSGNFGKNSSYNVNPSMILGHANAWADGVLYTNTAYTEEYDFHMQKNGLTNKTAYSDKADNKDILTTEWKKFDQRRRTPNVSTVISDFLILQTSGGDQSIFYFHKQTAPTETQKHFDKVVATQDEMFTNNPNSIFNAANAEGAYTLKVEPNFINIGGFNGNFKDVATNEAGNKKYHPYNAVTKQYLTVNGTQVATFLDTDPAGTITRPARKGKMYLVADDIKIKTTAPNKLYSFENSTVFYKQMLAYWSTDKDRGVGPLGNIQLGLQQYANTALLKDKWGEPMGLEYTTTYNGNDNINSVVVYTPTSVEDAVVLPLSDVNVNGTMVSRDQRVAGFNAPNLNDEINKLKICPLDPALCEFRVLDCKYLHDTKVADFDFEPKYTSSVERLVNGQPVVTTVQKDNTRLENGSWITTNKVSGIEYTLPAGFTVENLGKVGVGPYLKASGTRWSIPFSDLGIAAERSNKIYVEMDFFMNANNVNKSMLVSFWKYDFWLNPNDGTNLGMFNTGSGSAGVQGAGLVTGNAWNRKVKIGLEFGFNNIVDAKAYINGVPCPVTVQATKPVWQTVGGVRQQVDTVVAVTDLLNDAPQNLTSTDIGAALNIGAYGANDSYAASYYLDNLTIWLKGGTNTHNSTCYKSVQVCETNRIHVHDANCYLTSDLYTCADNSTTIYDLGCGQTSGSLTKTFNNTSTGISGANTNNSSGTLGGTISMTGGMYLWTVPTTGTYTIETYGARGGGTYGGRGAKIQGDFNLTAGEQLVILVGQSGTTGPSNLDYTNSGGGGTFVAKGNSYTTATPLIVAGGGGGGLNSSANYAVTDASTTTAAKDGYMNGDSYAAGYAGTAGYGSTTIMSSSTGNTLASGGAGFYGNSINGTYSPAGSYGALAYGFRNGGAGGNTGTNSYGGNGGFGGGGGAGHANGGGGGYTGGGNASYSNSGVGGGGGSYNSGTNQINTASANAGQGKVVISTAAHTHVGTPGLDYPNGCYTTPVTISTYLNANYQLNCNNAPTNWYTLGCNNLPLNNGGWSACPYCGARSGHNYSSCDNHDDHEYCNSCGRLLGYGTSVIYWMGNTSHVHTGAAGATANGCYTTPTHVHTGTAGLDYANGCYTKPTVHKHNTGVVAPITLNYTGGVQAFTVPATGTYKLEAWGAQGGNNYSVADASGMGQGGYTAGTVTLTQGQVLYVYVGKAGANGNALGSSTAKTFNGGGAGRTASLADDNHQGGQGGGATDFRLQGGAWNDVESLKRRILVAGGGGGTGCASILNPRGDGGSTSGKNTYNTQPSYVGASAYGGTQSAGGASNSYSGYNSTGSFGNGADATQCGAGGGGGYYGGGSTYTGGGGGGSSFVTGYTGCDTTYRSLHGSLTFSSVTMQQGGNIGNGKAVITPINVTTCTKLAAGSLYCTGELNTDSDLNYHRHSSSCLETSTVIAPANFKYTGNMQTFVAPVTGVYTFEAWGASGGMYTSGETGGRGGYTKGEILLTKGQTIYVHVGQKGYNYPDNYSTAAPYNGGGEGYGGGGDGGGATDFRLIPGVWNDVDSLNSRIMVAAGGGGADLNAKPGVGGNLTGGNATNSQTGNPGYGGTQTSTGAGNGGKGSWGFGGGKNTLATVDGGGGGGGYYGGSSGTGGHDAGGGGSSFISGYTGCNAIDLDGIHTGQPKHYSGKVFTNAVMQSGVNTEDGRATITLKDGSTNVLNEIIAGSYSDTQVREYLGNTLADMVLSASAPLHTWSGWTVDDMKGFVSAGSASLSAVGGNLELTLTSNSWEMSVPLTVNDARAIKEIKVTLDNNTTLTGAGVNTVAGSPGYTGAVALPNTANQVLSFKPNWTGAVSTLYFDFFSGTANGQKVIVKKIEVIGQGTRTTAGSSASQLIHTWQNFGNTQGFVIQSPSVGTINASGINVTNASKTGGDVYVPTNFASDAVKEVRVYTTYAGAMFLHLNGSGTGIAGTRLGTYTSFAVPSGAITSMNFDLASAGLITKIELWGYGTASNTTGGSGTVIFQSGTPQSNTVNLAAGAYILEVWGAEGGSYNGNVGGKGGYAKGLINLTQAQTIYTYVGQKGANNTSSSMMFGGGGYSVVGGAGGGASDIRVGGTALSNRVIVAGGGGGADGSGSGGAGGGLSGTIGSIVDGLGGGGAGTQTSRGVDATPYRTNNPAQNEGGAGSVADLGGGGGGYYGGGLAGNSGGGGGSGYIGGVTSGSGVTAQTIAGNQSFAAPGGGSETGHIGNGYVQITSLFSPVIITYTERFVPAAITFVNPLNSSTARAVILNNVDLIPQTLSNGLPNPIFICKGLPYNEHKHTEGCQTLRVFNCTEPHHNGEHYDGANRICWSACKIDANHANKKQITLPDGSVVNNANFLQIDFPFRIFFPNRGNFAGNDALGLSIPQSQTGYGYRNNCSTTQWTREKRVKFEFSVLYEGQLYAPNEWVELPVNQEYFDFYVVLANREANNASVVFEAEAINCNAHLQDALQFPATLSTVYASKLAAMKTAMPTQWLSALQSGYKLYDGYGYLSNYYTWKDTQETGLQSAINGATSMKSIINSSFPTINETAKPITSNDNTLYPSNLARTSSMESMHGGTKTFYLDLLGRIGNFTILDTEDYRFSNFFKQPKVPTEWLVEGFIKQVDQAVQNFYVGDQYDLRGNQISQDTRWLNTFGTQNWTQGINGDVTKPNIKNQVLTGDLNNISQLKKEELRFGYDIYTSIVTVGNYALTPVQVIPYYYALNLTTGATQPVDVYISKDGVYKAVNKYNNAANGVETEPLYKYNLNLDWTKESERRNYTMAEYIATNKAAEYYKQYIYSYPNEDNIGPNTPAPTLKSTIPVDLPMGANNYLGTSQLMILNGRHRTFVGSEDSYGNAAEQAKWGVNKNPGSRLDEINYVAAAQRWHFKLGVPSSAVFVPTGITPNKDTIKIVMNKDYVILSTMSVIALGDLWAIEYKQPWITNLAINGKTYDLRSANLPPIVGVYSANQSSLLDVDVIDSH